MVFTLSFPVVLLVILGTIFDGTYEGSDVTSAHYFVPGMLAAGLASTTFLNLGGGIAADRGLSNGEIGQALFISEATVKTHLLRAFAKLGVSDRTAAVTSALAAGLLDGRAGT